MRAKPTSNSRAGKSNHANGKPSRANGKPNRPNGKSQSASSKINRNKGGDKKNSPDFSVLRQPVDTSVSGLRQAVKVFETGTPEVLDLLSYDCDVIYECKVCRNLFRSLANFISHKRVYCTQRYSQCQDLQRSNKQGDDATIILGEKPPEKLPTRITARRDLTSIVEALGGQRSSLGVNGHTPGPTVHLEPMENTSYGVFQTVLKKPEEQNLMRNQVQELQNLLSNNEVVLGPDGRVLQNGLLDLRPKEDEEDTESDLFCAACNVKFANRKTLAKHKRHVHEVIRTCYSCPCCKNYFSNTWGVYRHLLKVHRKTNEQVRRLRSQIHKKDFRVEKPAPSTTSGKKTPSPSKKKADQDQQRQVLQHNKEWVSHFENDLRCGGCAKKFERKAALMSHSQICQKRIAACNRVATEPSASQAVAVQNPMTCIVALSPLSVAKKPLPKPSPEKKIGIQVRMNYCKSPSQPQSSRQLRCLPSAESYADSQPINSVDMKESSVLEQFLKDASKCGTSQRIDKVSSYLSDTLDKVGSYEISTCKRSTFLRSNVKNKSLEAKCLQLRSALENGLTDRLKVAKDKEETYFDGNTDNTSESNSAISSLSSQLTPLVDKGYIEVEQSIEIKNINISRKLDTPTTEADSTSNGLHMTYNSRTYTGSIKLSPTKDITCGEVSTSAVSDGMSHLNSTMSIDPDYLHDDEVSVSLKPMLKHEIKNWSPGSEFENTISILTRNQLKAICKDDMLPVKIERKTTPVKKTLEIKTSPINDVQILKQDDEIDLDRLAAQLKAKKFHKYINWKTKTCYLCNKSFRSTVKDNLYRHVCLLHTNWKRFECLFNDCTFQCFQKPDLLHHIQKHSEELNGKPVESLIGVIDKSKWNLKVKKTSKSAQPKLAKQVIKINLKKAIGTKKVLKPVKRPTRDTIETVKTGNVKVKSENNAENGLKQITLAMMKKNFNSSQKLLTDFTSFTGVKKASGKNVPKMNVLDKSKSSVGKEVARSVEKRGSKRLRSPVQNGIHKEEASPGRTTVKKKTPESSPVQKKEKVVEVEIIEDFTHDDNHITSSQQSNNDATVAKGRSSRASSRKSSASCVEQQRAKSLVNSVIKNEDSNTLCTPVAYGGTEPEKTEVSPVTGARKSVSRRQQPSAQLLEDEAGDAARKDLLPHQISTKDQVPSPVLSEQQTQDEATTARHPDSTCQGSEGCQTESVNSANIIDSASLEEEESQESDRPVDDLHLKETMMEVIFGSATPSHPAVTSPGRPVRNKSRPKRDSDFILGSQKEEDQEVKVTRKVSKSNISKSGSETSTSSKKSK